MVTEGLGELRLTTVLEAASRVDGPVRLFAPRANVAEPGLLPHGRGKMAELLEQLLGTLLVEVPRPANQPRRVVLTSEGIKHLMRHRAPAERAGLVRGASPLYRDRLLRAWKKAATMAEQGELQACLAELYGDLFEDAPTEEVPFEHTSAKELVLSWSRANDPEVREGLARAMISVGLRQLGNPGDQVSFTGRHHVSDESLFKGDPVEIVVPGWTAPESSGGAILQKAQVKPLP